MIVVMQPGIVRLGPGFITVICRRVCPLLRECPIKPFDFAIGLRSIRASVTMLHPVPERSVEHTRAVTRPVVCHHFTDFKSGLMEELSRPYPKPGRGILTLILKNLGIDQPGIVINRVMQVPVAT